jgi:hypothetical protein
VDGEVDDQHAHVGMRDSVRGAQLHNARRLAHACRRRACAHALRQSPQLWQAAARRKRREGESAARDTTARRTAAVGGEHEALLDRHGRAPGAARHRRVRARTGWRGAGRGRALGVMCPSQGHITCVKQANAVWLCQALSTRRGCSCCCCRRTPRRAAELQSWAAHATTHSQTFATVCINTPHRAASAAMHALTPRSRSCIAGRAGCPCSGTPSSGRCSARRQ